MPSRRRLLRTVGALAAVPLVTSAPAAAAPTRELYDPRAVTDAPVVAAGAAVPGVRSHVALPQTVTNRLRSITQRYDSITASDSTHVTAGVARSPEHVAGCLTVHGSFDAAAVRSEARADAAHTDVSARDADAARFEGTDTTHAVSISDAAIRVGHAPSLTRAHAHIDAARSSTGFDGDADTFGGLRDALSGDAVGYASLSADARPAVRAALHDIPDTLDALLAHASAVGVSVTTRDDVDTRLQYGAVLDAADLSVGETRRLVAAADATLADPVISQDGHTVVLETTADTPPLTTLAV
ncbi:hypothetical protein [Halobacterium salinarum]|uniref:hypothetical protein n=1 Tax=Halobacterium salinarum TaxID=2242 RepID=UPI00255289B8|nr:hypothetical protein [Halobacterium salinarum]MDL0133482.1 hypothetical protein [Halobacterium salinarum]WJK63092.1 hypothetical protein QSJ49_07450 [Halobacterium salinarum]